MPHDTPTAGAADALASTVAAYHEDADVPALIERLDEISRDYDADTLIAVAEPYLGLPLVVGPLYEHVVREQPGNARAMVILANAYWLTGRGPDVVGELAARALAAEPANRGAWHLWALTESEPRLRMGRWQQVSTRFPEDQLALANLADAAAGVASAEHDPVALKLAIATYEQLLANAEHREQRDAVERALQALRGWRF